MDSETTPPEGLVDGLEASIDEAGDDTMYLRLKRDLLDFLNAFGKARYKVGLPLPSSNIHTRDATMEGKYE